MQNIIQFVCFFLIFLNFFSWSISFLFTLRETWPSTIFLALKFYIVDGSLSLEAFFFHAKILFWLWKVLNVFTQSKQFKAKIAYRVPFELLILNEHKSNTWRGWASSYLCLAVTNLNFQSTLWFQRKCIQEAINRDSNCCKCSWSTRKPDYAKKDARPRAKVSWPLNALPVTCRI